MATRPHSPPPADRSPAIAQRNRRTHAGSTASSTDGDPPAGTKTCASIDMFVSGLGNYNSANARHAVKELKNVHLYATKASWQTWERLSVHSAKFTDLFWVLKMAAGCVGDFMDEYFLRPRRTHLRSDDAFNWSTVPALVDHLLRNREQMLRIADGGMTPQRYRMLKDAIDEAGWTSMTPADLAFIRKKDEGCFWLLCWVRSSVFRKFSTERLKVVGDARLRRYALRTAVTFVSDVMREHTPLYYVSGKSWISAVADDEGDEDAEDDAESDSDSSEWSSDDER